MRREVVVWNCDRCRADYIIADHTPPPVSQPPDWFRISLPTEPHAYAGEDVDLCPGCAKALVSFVKEFDRDH